MRAQRLMIVGAVSVLAGSLAFAQVGRGGSQWQTAFGDAQRTSWVRADDKISVAALSKPGFELQWSAKLDNQPRGVHGLKPGVTAAGVTLFIPMSLVVGSSNTVYGIDNDLGYIVWQRRFNAALPVPTANCPGGISAGATRIVRLDGAVSSFPGFGGGRGAVGYRSVLGEPGKACRSNTSRTPGGDPSPAPKQPRSVRAAWSRCKLLPSAAARGAPPAERIPDRRAREKADRCYLCPSGVGCMMRATACRTCWVCRREGHAASTPFLPATRDGPHRSQWHDIYATTFKGGAPASGRSIWTATQPVVSWRPTADRSRGSRVVGRALFADRRRPDDRRRQSVCDHRSIRRRCG